MQNLPHAIKGITLIPNTTVNCAIPIQTGFSKSHQKWITTVEPHLTDTSLLQTHSSGSNSVHFRGTQLCRAILLLPWTHASCPFWILLCSFGEKSETKSRTESLGLRLHNQAFDSFHYVDMEGKDTPDLSHITYWNHPNTSGTEGLTSICTLSLYPRPPLHGMGMKPP